jgi:hypothetical protein
VSAPADRLVASAAGASVPAPRVIRLPRIKFKRPRWPKGNRFYLVMTILEVGFAVGRILQIIENPNRTSNWVYLGWDLCVAIGWGWFWWDSRDDDDDGPNTT